MALDALAPAARNECDALIVRKKLAAALGKNPPDAPPAPTVQQLPQGSWTANGVLSLCVDPDAAQLQQLTTTIESESPALIGRRGLGSAAQPESVATSSIFGRQTVILVATPEAAPLLRCNQERRSLPFTDTSRRERRARRTPARPGGSRGCARGGPGAARRGVRGRRARFWPGSRG